ncbi:PfkB family carbohydrate kinase [Hoeflea marina]|uniref:PfkB family carbohydrate kinase n=1 Tax=Hoeflea marina TaxID=274592 RepID=UPI000D70CFFA|nr:PfkB family carbohydrate kinase [Hoeflea marina]
MPRTILCVGALTMDTIFRLETLPLTAGKFIPLDAVEVAEGMASAQAASIVRLGGSARLWASAGDDVIGDRLVAELSAEGVDCRSVRRVAGTRSAFSSIFVDMAGERIIVPHYDPALRAAPDALPDLDGVDVVSVDARWPEAAEMALREASARGIPGVLDADVAAVAVLDRLCPLASHIVASEPACRLLTGADDPADGLKNLASRHPGFVAVTAGERGCFWHDRRERTVRHQPAPMITAIDTLAAGDVFHGAFALGLAEGLETAELIRRASAAAAIKCTRFGGRLGAPSRAELDAFLAATGI